MSKSMTEIIKDTRRDMEDIDTFNNDPDINKEVITRLGNKYPTLANYSNQLAKMIESGFIKIDDLQEVIDIAAAAGAGANGWIDKLVVTWSGRLQDAKNKDTVSILDINSDIAIALASSEDYESILIPNGNHVADVAASDVPKVLKSMSKLNLSGKLTIKLPSGKYTLTEPTIFKNKGGANLSILGADNIRCSIIGVNSVTGSKGNYLISLKLSISSGASVGDFIHTSSTVGTLSEVHRGGWEIIGVNGQDITVKNTYWRDTFPETTVTSSTSYIIKTRLHYENVDAWVVNDATIGFVNNIAITGNSDEYWLSSNIDSTEKGTHGLCVGSNTIAVNGKPDNVNKQGIALAHVSCGDVMTFSGFDQQGIVTELTGSFYGNFVSACNNKRRGFYASTASGMRCKHITASGNFLDGAIADINGAIYASSSSAACGNGGSGFSVNGGNIVADTAVTIGNAVGFNAAVGGTLQATNMKSYFDVSRGAIAQYGSTIYLDNAYIEGSAVGVYSFFNASIRATNVTLKNNTINARADESGVINLGSKPGIIGNQVFSLRNGGLVLVGSTPHMGSISPALVDIKSRDANSYVRLSSSSAGDSLQINLIRDGENRQIFNVSQASLYPIQDSMATLGRASNKWSEIYSSTGVISTSDERLKQQFRSLSDREKAAALEIKKSIYLFKFNDAVNLKGDSARWHCGVGAQQVVEIMERYNLKPFDYAFICKDVIDNRLERYAIRYSDLSMFILSAI